LTVLFPHSDWFIVNPGEFQFCFTKLRHCIVIELEQAPPYLQQEFKIIRDLDEQVQNITTEATAKTNELLRIAKNISKDERVKRLIKIQTLYQTAEELSNDKVSRAESIYELVDRQIQRLDADMMEFKKASVVKTMKKSRKKALSIANVKMPASAAFVLALTNDPKNITDMPIDPNEPTYCICGDVSYGEMVACDNKNCPIEWFHFGCVGLTSKPKGAWFCSQCSEAKGFTTNGTTTRSHSKPGVNAPFKSPLRPGNEKSKGISKSLISTSNLDESVMSNRGNPIKKNLPNSFASSSLLLSPGPESEQELDKSIADLMSRICEVRNLESFTTDDVEKEMKFWRDLLHEYNDTKDVCLYIFGQLAQLKMTTVKEIFKEYNLDVDD
uniref:Inhibitor of growth protein n=1 Tax=Hymenolepis diminuta TaxID=6216 RepID=A0A0R3SCP4_HYMDI